jgi:DNA-binding XRE family transcriptional regulator
MVGPEMTPDALRVFRARAGLSLSQLGTLLGVSRMAVYYWEHERRPIPPYLGLAIAYLRLLYGLAHPPPPIWHARDVPDIPDDDPRWAD